mmetsp:Transcript_28976/g.58375  ORF Transcript_28976/g.58375 Transcript_28976/m.58375 type:complete len:257 (+) Transcript_28976:347-1117(+)
MASPQPVSACSISKSVSHYSDPRPKARRERQASVEGAESLKVKRLERRIDHQPAARHSNLPRAKPLFGSLLQLRRKRRALLRSRLGRVHVHGRTQRRGGGKALLDPLDGRLCVIPDLLDIASAVDLVFHPLVIVVLEDRRRLRCVHAEALLDRLDVVVRSAARLPALEAAGLHYLLRAIVEKDASKGQLISHHLLPAREVIGIAREAIDEEALPACRPDRIDQQLHSHLHGDNLALLDVLIDHVALRRAGLALRAQ